MTGTMTAADAGARTHRWRWVALVGLLTAEAMNMLDATVVQVAGPVIAGDLGGPRTEIPWFSAAYTLPFAMLLITGGRLGDIVGRRRMFVAGVSGFASASVVCALAPSVTVLIGARVVQGAAAAMIIPQTFGLIRATFAGRDAEPGHTSGARPEMARALSWMGPVMGVAAMCGPVVGAALTHADLWGSSWRSVFLVNVPLAAGVLALALLLGEDRAAHRPRLDLLGTALAASGFGLVVYPLLSVDGGAGPWLGGLAGGGILVVFVVQQRRAGRRGRSPLVETTLFAGRAFPAALVASTAFFAVMNGLMLVIVLHAELGMGRDVLTAGFTLLTWSAASAAASWVAGAWLVARWGSRLMLVGLGVLTVGLVAALVVYATGAVGWLPVALAVGGVGIGLFTVPFFTAALAGVAPRETGSAAGLLNAVQQLGATLGIAVLGGVFLQGLAAEGARSGAVLAIGAGLALVGVAAVAAWIMLDPRRLPV